MKGESDVIDMISYDSGFACGYSEGRKEGFDVGWYCYKLGMMQERSKRKRIRKAKKERLLYFLKQKLLGMGLLIISISGALIPNFDGAGTLLLAPFALWIIFTNEEVMY